MTMAVARGYGTRGKREGSGATMPGAIAMTTAPCPALVPTAPPPALVPTAPAITAG